MQDSMTTTAPRRVMTGVGRPLPGVAAVEVECPDWCRVSDADHENDDAGRALHIGRLNGSFEAQQVTGEGITAGYCTGRGAVKMDDLSPAELRRLAADAIAAAVWIESAAGVAPSGPRFVGQGDHLFHINNETVLMWLGVDEYGARGLVEAGKLRASKIIEGRTFVTGEAILDYVRERQAR